MIQIEINIKNLAQYREKLIVDRAAYQSARKQMPDVTYSGEGKVAAELSQTNEACEQLMELLDTFYERESVFLQCAEDGIVAMDEYVKKMLQSR